MAVLIALLVVPDLKSHKLAVWRSEEANQRCRGLVAVRKPVKANAGPREGRAGAPSTAILPRTVTAADGEAVAIKPSNKSEETNRLMNN